LGSFLLSGPGPLCLATVVAERDTDTAGRTPLLRYDQTSKRERRSRVRPPGTRRVRPALLPARPVVRHGASRHRRSSPRGGHRRPGGPPPCARLSAGGTHCSSRPRSRFTELWNELQGAELPLRALGALGHGFSGRVIREEQPRAPERAIPAALALHALDCQNGGWRPACATART
jgi:hypothetical protein